MKKLLLTVMLFMTALTGLMAKGFESVLKVRLNDNTPIMIRVDQQSYDDKSKLVTVDAINPGRHRLKVFTVTKYGFSNKALVYDGYVNIEPGTMTYAVVDRVKKTVRINVDKIVTDNDRRDDKVRYPNDPIDKSKYGNHNNGHDRYNNNRRDAFSATDMNDLKDRVNDRFSDADRLKLMKTALNGRTLATEQVRVMLGWLSFDNGRLDFAKWAYNITADRRDYWKLEKAFSFSRTKEDFMNFLNGQR